MGVIVDVTDHGADPTGARDSAPAVAAAIAALGAGPGTLRFPRGTYALAPEPAPVRELYCSNTVGADQRHRHKTIAVLLEGVRDVVVDGDRSTLVVHGRQTTIAALDSSGVTVRDLTLDIDVPTVVEPTVTAVGTGPHGPWRELSVPAVTRYRVEGARVIWLGGPGPDGAPRWTGADGLDYHQVHDPAGGRTWRADDPVFTGVVAAHDLGRDEAGRGRIRLDYAPGTPEPGDVGLVHQYRRTTRDHPGMFFENCTDVRLEGVTVRYLHGFGVLAQHGTDLRITGCEFAPDHAAGRHTAGFADFVQASGMAGHVEIADTLFDGPHDDPINVHGTYLRVLAAEGDELELGFCHDESAGYPVVRPGEQVRVVAPDALVGGWGPVPVLAVDGPSGRDHERPLDRLRVRLAEPVPDWVRAAAGPGADAPVLENLTAAPSVTVTGCTFRHVPTRGVLVTTPRPVRITGNRFERMTMPTLSVSADARDWFESGPVTDLLFADNDVIEPGAAVVSVDPTVPADAAPVHGRIEVRGNRVTLADDVPLVAAHAVADLVVAGNLVAALPAALRAH